MSHEHPGFARRVAAYAYVAATLSMAWATENADGSRDAFAEVVRILEQLS